LVGKTPLILAPLVVGLALLFLAFWFGRFWERSGKRYAAQFIDPDTHTSLMEIVRRILSPADPELGCYLPPAVKEQAEKVLATAHEQAARRARVELRRRGF
jgi:hypothetical protein